ncbi:MAG: cupredoxin domain-containing protein [Novosphingobium sp.]
MRAILALAAIALATGTASSVGAQVDYSSGPVIEVDLSSFKFSPAKVELKAGQPNTLTLINKSSGGHNFSASEFFAAADIAPQDAGRVKKGAVEVGKGKTVAIHLVPKAGQYDLKCSHFGHSTFGMTGVIVVR